MCYTPLVGCYETATLFQYNEEGLEWITDASYTFDGNLDTQEGYIDGEIVTNKEALLEVEEHRKQVSTPIERVYEINDENLEDVLGI